MMSGNIIGTMVVFAGLCVNKPPIIVMCLRTGDYKMPSVHLGFSSDIFLGTLLS